MEIIVQLCVWIVELFGELGLQLVMELLAEIFGHVYERRAHRSAPTEPWIAALAYLLLGAAAGAISLWLLPDLFLKGHWARIANVILTPIASGLIMAWIGRWRSRHHGDLIRLDTFGYAFAFALSMALVRYIWGH